MGLQTQNLNLVLSTDAKPRLKWTSELHQRFIEAVNQLGGADKATPKSLMRVMGIPGLTLYHLKSHLQKYRLGKLQQDETCSDSNNQDYKEMSESSDGHFSRNISDGADNQFNESSQIAQALHVQMEVQRKLHEQIEVQRRLQMRIETQGKYLQSVLKKAQETLAGYNSSSVGMEQAKAELSQLVSMVNTNCSSSSYSELTEADDETRKQLRNNICSRESSLTSSESSDTYNKINITCVELSLMDTQPEIDENRARKRSRSDNSEEHQFGKRLPTHNEEEKSDRFRSCGLMSTFDLNREYQNENDSSDLKEIDLNSKGLE